MATATTAAVRITSENPTANHGFFTFLPLFFIFVAFVIAIIRMMCLLCHDHSPDLIMTQGVELVNGRGRFDTSRPRQESSAYSSRMAVVFRINHSTVVHAINSNGARDEAVVSGRVSESTTGGTTTVDEQPVVVVPTGEGLSDGSSGETTECMICLGEITDGQIVRFLPECRHAFHGQCIDAWLTDNVSCPLCRRAVVPFHNN